MSRMICRYLVPKTITIVSQKVTIWSGNSHQLLHCKSVVTLTLYLVSIFLN
ncbi:hypothetical protein HanRHA438_Chr03g0133661 [Helianthus annuus]|nr:hypothetical protein HanRHA438_Chr03g0133661 [Helianthus annuus]